MTTACALIIGDEILTGKVHDENSHTLAKFLFDQGVDLQKIVVIGDTVAEIATHVRALSSQYDYVFTSGGIGPTHDDRTYEGVAEAFGLELRYDDETLDRLHAYMRDRHPDQPVNTARKKMALLPTPCRIFWTDGIWVPGVIVNNVYVLPGIPILFFHMLSGLKGHLQGTPKSRQRVFTQKTEGEIADCLSAIQDAHPHTAIGSYPKLDHPDYRVMVTVEGVDAAEVAHVAKEIEDQIANIAPARATR